MPESKVKPEHNEVIRNTLKLLKDRGFSFKESQMVTNLVAMESDAASDKGYEALREVLATLNNYELTPFDKSVVAKMLLQSVQFSDTVKGIDTARDITEQFEKAGIDSILTKALLQMLAEKVNNQISDVQMSAFNIEEL